jgi:hypothetical protein
MLSMWVIRNNQIFCGLAILNQRKLQIIVNIKSILLILSPSSSGLRYNIYTLHITANFLHFLDVKNKPQTE